VEANRDAAEEQLISRKQHTGETLDAYTYDIKSMCHRLEKSARDTVAAFVRGLLPNIQGQVAVLQPATIEDAEKIARTASTYARGTASVTNVEGDAYRTLTDTLGQLIEEIRTERRRPEREHGYPTFAGTQEHRPSFGRGPGRGFDRKYQVSPGHYKGDITCHRCLKKGHIARNCPTEVRDLPQGNANVPQ